MNADTPSLASLLLSSPSTPSKPHALTKAVDAQHKIVQFLNGHDDGKAGGFITRLDRSPLSSKRTGFLQGLLLNIFMLCALALLAATVVWNNLYAPYPASIRLAYLLTQNIILASAALVLARSTLVPFFLRECVLRYHHGFRKTEITIRRLPAGLRLSRTQFFKAQSQQFEVDGWKKRRGSGRWSQPSSPASNVSSFVPKDQVGSPLTNHKRSKSAFVPPSFFQGQLDNGGTNHKRSKSVFVPPSFHQNSIKNDYDYEDWRKSIDHAVDPALLYFRLGALLSKHYWTLEYQAIQDAYTSIQEGLLAEEDFDYAVWESQGRGSAEEGSWIVCELWKISGAS